MDNWFALRTTTMCTHPMVNAVYFTGVLNPYAAAETPYTLQATLVMFGGNTKVFEGATKEDVTAKMNAYLSTLN